MLHLHVSSWLLFIFQLALLLNRINRIRLSCKRQKKQKELKKRERGKEKETFSSCHGACSRVCEKLKCHGAPMLGLWNRARLLPSATGILTFSLKGHQSFHVSALAFNASRKGEEESETGRRWNRTQRYKIKKRKKRRGDQLSDQGQSGEGDIHCSYLIQSFWIVHGGCKSCITHCLSSAQYLVFPLNSTLRFCEQKKQLISFFFLQGCL